MIAHSASVRSCRPCILNLSLFGSLNHISAEKKIPFPFISTRPGRGANGILIDHRAVGHFQGGKQGQDVVAPAFMYSRGTAPLFSGMPSTLSEMNRS